MGINTGNIGIFGTKSFFFYIYDIKRTIFEIFGSSFKISDITPDFSKMGLRACMVTRGRIL